MPFVAPGLSQVLQRAACIGEEHGTMQAGGVEAERLLSVLRHPGPQIFSTLVSYMGNLFVFSNHLIHKERIIMATSCVVLRIKAVHVCTANYSGTLLSTQQVFNKYLLILTEETLSFARFMIT